MLLDIVVLTLFVWVVYAYTLRCGFVSDDLVGICEYDGKIFGKQYRKEKAVSPYGEISKWLRYHLCGGNFPSKRNGADGKPIPTGKTPLRHHLLSVIIYNLAVLATYTFLTDIIGAKLALLSCLLFVAHPLGVQAVAWCSGIGYPLCLLWTSLSLALVTWFGTASHGLWMKVGVIIAFSVLQFLAVNAMFAAVMSCVVLAFLGYWWFALLALVVSVVTCEPVVKWTINHRKQEFKKQAMGDSTHISARKIIVAVKTAVYYLALSFWPKNLGLYHVWGYHYGPDLERDDRRFWLSLSLLTILTVTVFCFPVFPLKLALVWFFSFIWLFLNWVTIQQFIAERYAFIPTLGVCIALACLLQNSVFFYLVLGIFLMRTWAHLPTYDNELKFYISNTWNFGQSEVAYGNLGVTYVRLGQLGSAMDHWNTSTQINKEYDVPFYNIAARYKSMGLQLFDQEQFAGAIENLKIASGFIEKAINAKTCHFGKMWKKELDELRRWIADPMMLIMGEYTRLLKYDRRVVDERNRSKDPKHIAELDQALNNSRKKLQMWGNKINTDLQSIDVQIKAIDERLKAEIPMEERKQIVINQKILLDRQKTLRRTLLGK